MDTPAAAGIRDLIKAFQASSQALTTTLPKLGATVTYPSEITHGQVMAASKLAGKDQSRIGLVLIAQHCTFNGERLTVDEAATLPRRDIGHLVGLLLGDEDAGDAGN